MNDQNWSPYFNDRLISKDDGFYVIKTKEQDPIPLFCSICEFLYRTKTDESSHLEFGCCERCAMKWVHPDKNRWHNGFRPTRAEIVEDISVRPHLSIIIE